MVEAVVVEEVGASKQVVEATEGAVEASKRVVEAMVAVEGMVTVGYKQAETG
uniref:Uncharacterized protein n=1 Tax=Helianthus annuus TaxID=4232 RepID=A0A251SZG9_HELAN